MFYMCAKNAQSMPLLNIQISRHEEFQASGISLFHQNCNEKVSEKDWQLFYLLTAYTEILK